MGVVVKEDFFISIGVGKVFCEGDILDLDFYINVYFSVSCIIKIVNK